MNPKGATTGLGLLRPFLCEEIIYSLRKPAYARFFTSSRSLERRPDQLYPKSYPTVAVRHEGGKSQRVEELIAAKALTWPRITSSPNSMTIAAFMDAYKFLTPGQEVVHEIVTIQGRVLSCRVAGAKLLFVDLIYDGVKAQVVCSSAILKIFGRSVEFKTAAKLICRGDHLSASGYPVADSNRNISLKATTIPEIVSPSLTPLPRTLTDSETKVKHRHVDLLVNRSQSHIIRARSRIIQHIRNFLLDDAFTEVQTPLLSDKAGGAIARPFTTVATEFSDKQLALRVAPEIWLKRLVIGGMDRVFEIGPAFRNEGLDATHNPEFTSCEFYKSYADLEVLLSMTERMLSGIAELVTNMRLQELNTLPELDTSIFATPFKRIEFIPAIEEAIGDTLPDLSADNATESLLSIFERLELRVPASPTLPRLLDKLASTYIEPNCGAPTFVIHHPACLAPLAKSFLCPKTGQEVSARAELFMEHRELANMYEEENSPIAQRQKFLEQIQFRDAENNGEVDENYLEALECGLPPTGGWGAGLDRLVMLFTGAKRISDVLTFGSLRNVVNLGNINPTAEKKKVSETPDMKKD